MKMERNRLTVPQKLFIRSGGSWLSISLHAITVDTVFSLTAWLNTTAFCELESPFGC